MAFIKIINHSMKGAVDELLFPAPTTQEEIS